MKFVVQNKSTSFFYFFLNRCKLEKKYKNHRLDFGFGVEQGGFAVCLKITETTEVIYPTLPQVVCERESCVCSIHASSTVGKTNQYVPHV